MKIIFFTFLFFILAIVLFLGSFSSATFFACVLTIIVLIFAIVGISYVVGSFKR
ncbi:MAG: hypothetical protein MR830_03320 [Succinatimonas sp.]|nr:hypothetical protein [Succinatimonas sp.]